VSLGLFLTEWDFTNASSAIAATRERKRGGGGGRKKGEGEGKQHFRLVQDVYPTRCSCPFVSLGGERRRKKREKKERKNKTQ